MSDLSEEEIIKKLERYINGKDTMKETLVRAIEGLLDLYNKEKALAENHRIAFNKQTENLKEIEELYNKEKEKNKELEEYNKRLIKYNEGLYKSDAVEPAQKLYISKDKIKEFANRIKAERDLWNKDEEAEWGQLNKYETYDGFYNNILELLKGE